MSKCNVNLPNAALLKLNMGKDADETLLECFESKAAEINAEISAAASKELTVKNAISRIKAFDCSTLSGFQKDVCLVMKR
jgi:hypothetical protein